MEPLETFRLETEPSPQAQDRVRRRVRQALDRPKGHRAWWALGLGAAISMGIAGIALNQPLPDQPIPATVLDTSQAMQSISGGDVQLSWQGSGNLQGSDRKPEILWDKGDLSVEVTPERGIGLTVNTREALIEVIGTGFRVHRDALGTRIDVQHGRVRVQCEKGEERFLVADEQMTCLPISAAGMLARARFLQQNKQWDAILDTVEKGLKLAPPQGPVADELSVLQIEALDALGRSADVQAAAQAYLQGGTPARATDMRRFLVASFIGQSDCHSAMSHLDILMKESPIAEYYLNYAGCIAATDVKSARKNLEKSLQLSDNPEQRAAIQARLDQLRNGD